MNDPFFLFPEDQIITVDTDAPASWDESLPEGGILKELEVAEAPGAEASEPAAEASPDAGPVPEAGPGPDATPAPDADSEAVPDEQTFLLPNGSDAPIPFSLAPTAASCFGTIKTIYAALGRKGLDAFFELNSIALLPAEPGPAPVTDLRPPPTTTERLLFRARELVESMATRTVERIEVLAVDTARQRLKDAKEQILDETVRYFFTTAPSRPAVENWLAANAPGSGTQFNGTRQGNAEGMATPPPVAQGGARRSE